MQEVTIRVRANGPYLVKGPVRLVDVDGNEFTIEGADFVLCRCGHSATKPFCDGTHRRIGFQSVVSALPTAADSPGNGRPA